MNTNNPLGSILSHLLGDIESRISAAGVNKIPFFKSPLAPGGFNLEAVITKEGNVLLRHLVGKGIPAMPLDFSELEEIYLAAKAEAKKDYEPERGRSRSENFPLSDPLFDIKNSSRWAKSLARHEANNWPHPGISGTYELPSGEFTAYVSREEKTIDLRSVHTGGTLLATISFDDVARLEGIANPSVLPDGPNGCPVPDDKEEHFTFVAYVAKNVNGEWGTADTKLISPIDLLGMKDTQTVTFTTDLSVQAPEGKVAVYCVYDKLLGHGGCLAEDPFDFDASYAELKRDEQLLGGDKLLLAIGFIDKQ